MDLPRDSMVLCDRGYIDFDMLYKWNLKGVDFISRLKKNTTYEVAEDDLKQYVGNVLSDETIFLRGSTEKYPEKLRKVVVCDTVNHRTLILVTNNFELDAQTIAEWNLFIYRDLQQWLDQPFSKPPEPENFQMEFAF